jgi:NADPH:quinone reductase-like Zn-dependent oxidoreductase
LKHTRIVVARYVGPDALRVVEEERPEPQRGKARVRVQAAGGELGAWQILPPVVRPG